MKIALFVLLIQTLALADWRQIPADEFSLSAPPKKGSRAYENDYEKLLEYQKGNRKTECSLAQKQNFPNYDAFFADAEILSESQLEKAKPLVSKVMTYSIKIAGVFKTEYMRPRPYEVDARIQPCAKKPGGSKSYPSSHATAAVTGACVLAAIYPAKANALEKYGHYLGDVRAVVGVHHPSDVRAGQKLGQAVCDRLMADEEFSEELEQVQ